MTNRIIRKSIYLNATQEQVWAYLTDPDKLREWFHPPKTPLKQGEVLEMYGAQSGDRLIWGKVLTMRPHDLLEYSFTVEPMGDAVSHVKWVLDTIEGGTRLSLEHSGLPQGAEAFGLTLSLDKGWDDHISRMRTALHGDA